MIKFKSEKNSYKEISVNILNELKNRIFNTYSFTTFKQIKMIEDRFNVYDSEKNLFFLLNLEEREIEKEKLKSKSNRKLSIQLEKELRQRKKDVQEKYNFSVERHKKRLDIEYKNYINNKIKRENTIDLNMFLKNNYKKDFLYSRSSSNNQDYLNLMRRDKEKFKHLKLKSKGNIAFLGQVNNIELRKGSNQFLKPYYFFPRKYNEKNMTSSLKH
jgi:hypothetical protein